MNNFLQAKFKPGFSDLGRFLLNTVAGAGFFDPPASSGSSDTRKISDRRSRSGACRRADR